MNKHKAGIIDTTEIIIEYNSFTEIYHMTLSSFSPLQDSLFPLMQTWGKTRVTSRVFMFKFLQVYVKYLYVLNCVTVKCYVPLWGVFF